MLPHVIIHNAVSVDGRIDWFSANVSKYYELTTRWKEDAILAGTDTLLKAYPEEKIMPEDAEAFEHKKNIPDDSRPLLVVPDSGGRLRHILHVLRHEPYWRDMVILTSNKTPQSYINYLEKRDIAFIPCGDDHVNYRDILDELNTRYGVKVVRVDSGGTLNGILLREGLVNEVSILIHPYLVGGITPSSIYRAPDLIVATGVLQLKLVYLEQLENDLIWLIYEIMPQL